MNGEIFVDHLFYPHLQLVFYATYLMQLHNFKYQMSFATKI
jgi:hypothetical protein